MIINKIKTPLPIMKYHFKSVFLFLPSVLILSLSGTYFELAVISKIPFPFDSNDTPNDTPHGEFPLHISFRSSFLIVIFLSE